MRSVRPRQDMGPQWSPPSPPLPPTRDTHTSSCPYLLLLLYLQPIHPSYSFTISISIYLPVPPISCSFSPTPFYSICQSTSSRFHYRITCMCTSPPYTFSFLCVSLSPTPQTSLYSFPSSLYTCSVFLSPSNLLSPSPSLPFPPTSLSILPPPSRLLTSLLYFPYLPLPNPAINTSHSLTPSYLLLILSPTSPS